MSDVIILAADEGEAERLVLRGFPAIAPSHDAASPDLAAYRGRTVHVTPRAKRERYGVASVLRVMSCTVLALPASFSAETYEPATSVCAPMFSDTPSEDDEAEPLPKGETALELVNANIEPIRYLCNPWSPEGCNLLAGRPKLGKTTLLRQKGAAIAGGGVYLGEPCQRTRVVFLSLEESRRIFRRKLELAKFTPDELANIVIFYEWPRARDGALQILRYADENPGPQHWIIDSLTRFRTPPDARKNAFVSDYEAMSELHGVTKARPEISIDVLHHTRKARGDDPIDDVSGTYGLTAACDSYAVMRYHDGGGAILHVGGRLWDRDASAFELRRGSHRWELVGEYAGLSDALSNTLDELRKSGGLTPLEAAKLWGITRQGAWDRLTRLVGQGKAECRNGVYHAL
jgi:hypothetical protein